MGRPKEHPEQHIMSPERARARFLKRNPTLAHLVEMGSRVVPGDALIRWLPEIAGWMRDLGERIAGTSEIPELAPDARELAEAVGGTAIEWVRRHDEARTLLEMARRMRSQEPPDLTPEFRDRCMPLAVLAVTLVERDGPTLTPLDLVLLEVATGVAKPTNGPDEAEYVRRLEAAGERLKRARKWVERRGTPISPDPGAPNPHV